MTEFPTIVYKCPGQHFGPSGTTYELIGVKDDAQLQSVLGDGWSKTLIEAAIRFIEPKEAIGTSKEVSNSAPTREEMIQQADKIGLKIDRRWNDAKLIEKINEAMKLV
jgi:hypothetical protein